VLAEDALRDLDDCPLVVEGGLAESRLGLFDAWLIMRSPLARLTPASFSTLRWASSITPRAANSGERDCDAVLGGHRCRRPELSLHRQPVPVAVADAPFRRPVS